MTSDQSTQPSEREKNGLHGPVRSVVEEQTYPAWTDADGKLSPEFKSWSKTEYDRDGRIAETRFHGSSRDHSFDGTEMVTRYTYGATGQLLRKTIQNNKGDALGEIIYHYDDQGRLQNITNSTDFNNPIAFRYDADGMKTKLAISKPINLPEGTTAVSQSIQHLFDDEGSMVSRLDNGSTITLYDERDRPIEVQLYDANGALMSRAVRVYDEQGRVIEEKMMMDDPLALIPAKQQKSMLDEGLTAQQIRDQIAQFLGGSEMWSEKYSYDAQGRKITTTRNTFNHINESVTTSYNEHGDPVKEVSQSTTRGSENPAVDEAQSSATIYAYEYDTNGNWTVKKRSSRALQDAIFKDPGYETRRTIEYF